MSLSHFQSEFEKLINRDYFSDKIHALREEAFSKFLNTGIPTQKWEDWRFTNLTRIAKGEYRISETQDGPNGEIEFPSFKMEVSIHLLSIMVITRKNYPQFHPVFNFYPAWITWKEKTGKIITPKTPPLTF